MPPQLSSLEARLAHRRGDLVEPSWRRAVVGDLTTAFDFRTPDGRRMDLPDTRGWYALVITVPSDPRFESRSAGHLENGEDSISDPGMGGLL